MLKVMLPYLVDGLVGQVLRRAAQFPEDEEFVFGQML